MGKQKIIKIIVAVFQDKEGKILLLQRNSSSKFGPMKWHLMSGKFEEGEEEKDCLHRELQEEMGITEFKVLKRIISKREWKGDLYKAYISLAEIEKGKIVLNEENLDYKWVNLESLDKLDVSPVVIDDLKEIGLLRESL